MPRGSGDLTHLTLRRILKRIYQQPRMDVMVSALKQRADELWQIRKKSDGFSGKGRKASMPTDFGEDFVDGSTDGGSEGAKINEDKQGFVEIIQLLLSILTTERRIADLVLPSGASPDKDMRKF